MPPPKRGSDKRGTGRREFGGRKYTPRRKVCTFCVDKIADVDYKDIPRLRRHLSERGKIEPRRKTGTCATHQRALSVALKRARHVALLPYTAEHIRLSGIVLRSPEDRRRDDRPRGPIGDGRAAPVEAGETAAVEAGEGAPAEGAVAEAAVVTADGEAEVVAAGENAGAAAAAVAPEPEAAPAEAPAEPVGAASE
jgi:small subunit ribosomal protein S18